MTDIVRMKEVIEDLRSEDYPNLSKRLVEGILEVEVKMYDPKTRLDKINALVKDYLAVIEEVS